MNGSRLPYLLPRRVEKQRKFYSGSWYFRAPESLYKDSRPTRDLTIVHSVYVCRLITTKQIERLCFWETKDPETRARICKRVLKRLYEQDVLRRRDKRIGGIRAGSTSFIYSLGANGAKVVSDKRLHYYVHDPSEYFMKHTLALSELYVQLHEEARNDKFELLDIQTEPNCWRVFLTLATGKQVLKPDMYVKLGIGNEELSYFVEMDRGTTYNTSLSRKLRVYENYYFIGKEEREHGVFPQVVWIVPDEKRKAVLEALCEPFNMRIEGLFVVAAKGHELDAMIGVRPP